MNSLIKKFLSFMSYQEDNARPDPEPEEVSQFMSMLAGFMNDRRYLHYGIDKK